ncbi:REP-associated tyrosine transposase [Gracilimonas sp. Q87]|uniref:REP-associated tyrosine transposase n=1 Tax=Gracilimonas sp. Q87 TaxID=3384766 RepID=UPI003983FF8D
MSGYKIYNQQQAHFITYSVVDWIDVFVRPMYKDTVVESLRYCQDSKGLRIHGWCLMTNHIHLIISAQEGTNLSDILRDMKRHTGKTILGDMQKNNKESRRKWMLWMFRQAGRRNRNNEIFQFWQHNNRPIEITTNKFFNQKMNYIHYNPVKEGFCHKPIDYPYSSARWYYEKKGLIEVDELLI